MTIRSLLLTGILTLAPVAVFAEGGHCHGGPGGAALRAELPALFAQADANGDGSLSPDEFKTFKDLVAQKRMELRFQRLDANGDGKVTLDEINAAAAARETARQNWKQQHQEQ